MKSLGYYNGKIGELEEMEIPMLDRAVYFGDGVYDVAYAVNYQVILLDEHIDRFYENIAKMKINPPINQDSLKDIILNLVKMLDCGDLQIYFQMSRGSGIREHAYCDNMKGNLLIMINEKKIISNIDVECITKEDTRFLHCDLKTLNLIPAVMAAKEAKDKNVYEVIFHRNGRITECSHSNVHIIKGNKFITAPLDNLILPGVSRKHLIKKMKIKGYEIQEREYYLDELYSADYVLLTAAGAPCLSVKKVDGYSYKTIKI